MQTSYYTNPPPPFNPGWQHSPWPGWGVNPAIRGPARLGVGAIAAKPMFSTVRAAQIAQQRVAIEPGAAKPFPWIYVICGLALLGAGGAYAYKKGLIKF